MEKKKYEIVLEGWLLGHYRQAGDVVEMTDAEAEYEMHKVKPFKAQKPAKDGAEK